jgi:hypothetical protein
MLGMGKFVFKSCNVGSTSACFLLGSLDVILKFIDGITDRLQIFFGLAFGRLK